MQSNEGIDVNLYIPSRVTWIPDGVRVSLAMETGYPAENAVAISISCDHPVEFTLRLRVPSWAQGRANVTTGERAIASGVPGTYIELRRRWKRGDTIRLTIPQDFRVEPIDEQHSETVALMRGPLQYVALNLGKGLNERPMPLPGSLRAQGAESFVEGSGAGEIAFVPLYQIGLETYTSYFTRA